MYFTAKKPRELYFFKDNYLQLSNIKIFIKKSQFRHFFMIANHFTLVN